LKHYKYFKETSDCSRPAGGIVNRNLAHGDYVYIYRKDPDIDLYPGYEIVDQAGEWIHIGNATFNLGETIEITKAEAFVYLL